MATTQYWYDGTALIYEEDDDGEHREYYYGPGGLLSMYDSDGGARRYHFYDGIGSTSELTDENGDELGTYVYDAFGVQISGPAVTNPFRYIGRYGYYHGAADSMYLLQQRYYRASVGRFWTKDPIGFAGGDNLYGYCEANPTNMTDPSGTGIITEVACYTACYDTVPNEVICTNLCRVVAGMTCNGLWSYCFKLRKTMAEVCLQVYHLLCAGQVVACPREHVGEGETWRSTTKRQLRR